MKNRMFLALFCHLGWGRVFIFKKKSAANFFVFLTWQTVWKCEGLANILCASARYRSLGAQNVRGDPRFVINAPCGAIWSF
jgi:hypothetical protein